MSVPRRSVLSGGLLVASGLTVQGCDGATANAPGTPAATAAVTDISGQVAFGGGLPSRLAAGLTAFPKTQTFVRTAGFESAGDRGGGLYRSVAQQPGHAGKFRSADGGWWELSEFNPTPMMFGARTGPVTGEQRVSNAVALQACIDFVALRGGGEILVAAERLELDGEIKGRTGVNVRGLGMQGTTLYWFNSAPDEDDVKVTGVALDLKGRGAGGYPADRTICTWSDMTLDGEAGYDGLIAVRVGHNYRSWPLLLRLKLRLFGHYGLFHDADNWNVSFVDIEIDQCGRRTENSAGIFKNPYISDTNYVAYTRCQVEGCGNDTSMAGGMLITTTTVQTNRGWFFTDCIVEGNFGAREVYVANMRGIHFKNVYHERVSAPGQLIGFDFKNVTGTIHGGVFAAEVGAPTLALQFRDQSDFSVEGCDFSGFSEAEIDIRGAKVQQRRNRRGDGPLRILQDRASELHGDRTPQFVADKGGTDQPRIAPGTFVKVTFPVEQLDTTNAYDSERGHRVRPQRLGVIQLKTSVTFTNLEKDIQVILQIRKNGHAYRSNVRSTTLAAAQSFDIEIDAMVTSLDDYFEVWVRHLSAAPRSISGQPDETWFSGVMT